MHEQFHCPHLNRMVTAQACYAMEETPLCQGCTGEMDTARQTLRDWLTAAYGDRYAISMQEDGIRIIVHEKMYVTADPCDEDGDTFLGVECGDYGGTHSHPQDVQQAVAALLEGRTTVCLMGPETMYSMIAPRQLLEEEPDKLAEWRYCVDAEGLYTPEEYARKLRVTLPPKELRFYCPEQQREVTAAECYDRGNSGRACYGETCPRVEAAVMQSARAWLQGLFGDRIALTETAPDGPLRIRFHENLTLDASYDGLFRTITCDVFVLGAHVHDVPCGDAAELARLVGGLLKGDQAFLVQPFLLGKRVRLISRDEVRRLRFTVRRARIVDGRGVFRKGEYLA